MRLKTIAVGCLLMLLVTSIKTAKAVSSIKLYFDNPTFSLKVGEKKTVKLMADSQSVYLSGVDLSIGYGSQIKVNSVSMNSTNFAVIQQAKVAGGQILLTGYNMGKFTNQLPKGIIEMATMELEGVAAGTVDLALIKNQMIGNDGAANGNIFYFTVNYIKPTISVGVVVTPTVIIGNGTDGVLKFRMTFAGVNNGAACANNWPVDITVRENNGNSKTYAGINLIPDGVVNNLLAFKGQVLLSEITTKNNLAVFIKAPSHMQVKYANNGQSGFYNQPGGNLIVDANTNNTVVQDFTGYPLLAGDVNRDGSVDGLDFSIVKTDVNKRTEGTNMVSDLNGNCKLESQDLTLLMLTMKDRQAQLY